ncbi:GNAT family N-acetyltransferase [Nocardioides marmotae]|uniref:GNAT family N-acetyltransferase n=1 Tax=Nocardioides marmotae TaxID=2663857 RepID=UPI0012B60791|nr:GNAT family N-acetyltransferase [Nocardioides marmotae]MBC9735591.1 GNAT family N-acetyltransferase [Nocardioides marmotae]MTB86687.1 GNAT family N-acetyltransferase [Nocardioides marmotae]
MHGDPASSVLVRHDFDSEAAGWARISHQVPHPAPFTRPWWLRHVARGTPTHLLVLAGEEPVGGIALTGRRVLGVELLRPAGHGVPCPDHVDLVAVPGHEERVAAAFAAWFRRPGARVLDLAGAPERSLAARALGVAARPMDVAPYEPLEPGGDGFLASRSASFRRNVRRTETRLARAGVRQWTATGASVAAALDAFEALHRDRPDRAPLLAQMPRLRPAVTEALAGGEARVDVLEVGEEPAAVSIAFVVAGRLALYQLARSTDRAHDGAGTALLVRVVEQAAAAGCHEVDLLRGEEAYKAGFASRRRVLTRVRAAHGARGRLLLAAWDGVRRLNALRRGAS